MAKIEKISVLQVVYLLIIFRIVSVFWHAPALSTPPMNQDVWIAELLSIVYIIIMSIPLVYLGKKFPYANPIQYSCKILGTVLGKFIGTLYLSYFIFECLILLTLIFQFLGSAIIPETPAYAIIIFMLATCTYTVYKGLEPIARGAEVFVPPFLLIIILFIILGLKDMDFKVFLPILSESSFTDINFGAFNFGSRYTDLLFLAMVIPNINDKKSIIKIVLISIPISILFIMLITAASQATLGIEQAKHTNYPFFIYSRLIDIFDLIQRIEFVSVFIWVLGTIGKLSAFIYITSLTASNILGKESYKIFIIPISIILFILSLTLKTSSTIYLSKLLSYKIFPYITFTFIFLIPFVMLLIYSIRRKSIKDN